MTGVRNRQRPAAAALVAALVLGVLLFVGFGHGLPHDSMDAAHGTGSVVAFCLIVFTALAPLVLAAPAAWRSAVPRLLTLGPSLGALLFSSAPPASARASPSWLQRYRN